MVFCFVEMHRKDRAALFWRAERLQSAKTGPCLFPSAALPPQRSLAEVDDVIGHPDYRGITAVDSPAPFPVAPAQAGAYAALPSESSATAFRDLLPAPRWTAVTGFPPFFVQ